MIIDGKSLPIKPSFGSWVAAAPSRLCLGRMGHQVAAASTSTQEEFSTGLDRCYAYQSSGFR